MTISRRNLLVGAGALTLGSSLGLPRMAQAASGPINPLVTQRADTQIFRHTDGMYYMTASVPAYDRLILRRASTLAGLATTREAVIWTRPSSGRMGGFIWAPELHMIDGRWHMYFAAGDAENVWNIRTYVLVCRDQDALSGRWEVLGRLDTGWDGFTLDSSIFVNGGQRYVTWAQKVDGDSNIYLAPLATPLTLAKPAMLLSKPTYGWERDGAPVNEGPIALKRNGKIFIVYSAAAVDWRYCLGMVTANENADLMNPASWTKSPVPVFKTSELAGVYGPGHNSFTVDELGRDVLVYHGRDYKIPQGDPLFDPNRHTRIQRFYWKADGTPDFGVPVGNGTIPDRLSPADLPNAYLAHSWWRLIVSTTSNVVDSQFRQVPGLAGTDTVSLSTVEYRNQYLVVQPDGTVALSTVDANNREAALRASFVTRPGLTNSKGISFVSAINRTAYLRHAGNGTARVEPISSAQRASATFLIS